VSNLKKLWQISRSNGNRISLRSLHCLKGLLIACALTVSACQSSLPMPVCVQSQVVVDPSLLVEPSYQTTLLDSLSSKPNEQAPK